MEKWQQGFMLESDRTPGDHPGSRVTSCMLLADTGVWQLVGSGGVRRGTRVGGQCAQTKTTTTKRRKEKQQQHRIQKLLKLHSGTNVTAQSRGHSRAPDPPSVTPDGCNVSTEWVSGFLPCCLQINVCCWPEAGAAENLVSVNDRHTRRRSSVTWLLWSNHIPPALRAVTLNDGKSRWWAARLSTSSGNSLVHTFVFNLWIFFSLSVGCRMSFYKIYCTFSLSFFTKQGKEKVDWKKEKDRSHTDKCRFKNTDDSLAGETANKANVVKIIILIIVILTCWRKNLKSNSTHLHNAFVWTEWDFLPNVTFLLLHPLCHTYSNKQNPFF